MPARYEKRGVIMAVFYTPHTEKRATIKCGDILINNNTFSPAHCGIVVSNQDVIHATGKGIKIDDIDMWGNNADMFRSATDLTTAEAGKLERIAQEIKDSASYGVGRAAFKSTFSTHTAAEGTHQRLNKYRERLKNHQGVVKHVYCSELVILCYQLAWIESDAINANHRLFIQLDGKHTWPSTLRRYLRSNANFKELGEYKKA